MHDEEIATVYDAILAIAEHGEEWADHYQQLPGMNDYVHKDDAGLVESMVADWFEPSHHPVV